MTISVRGHDDEKNHRAKPGVQCSRSRCRSRHDSADNAETEEQWSQSRGGDLLRDLSVPSKAFDLNAARTEEMMRVEVLRNEIGMQVPGDRWQQRDRAKYPETP